MIDEKAQRAELLSRRETAVGLVSAIAAVVSASTLTGCTEGPGVLETTGEIHEPVSSDVALFSDLRALATNPFPAGQDYRYVFVHGRTAPGDGGEGIFFWDASSNVADDDGVTLRPNDRPSSAGRWRRMNFGAVLVTWFGAKADGVTDSRAAIQAAITAGITYKRPVRIPAGNYYVDISSTTLDVAADASIHGDGIGRTVLIYGPDSIAARGPGSSLGFQLYGAANVTLEDMTLRGPLEADVTSLTIGILHVIGDGLTTLRRVRTERFTYGVKLNVCSIEAFDCYFGASLMGVLHGDGAIRRTGLFRNCIFDVDETSVDPDVTGEHCYYVNRGNNVDLEGCIFRRAPSTGLHIWGSAGLVTAEYVRVVNCIFESGILGHQLITNTNTFNQISGCRFIASTGDSLKLWGTSGGTIQDCIFQGTPGYTILDEGTTATWRFSDCTFGGAPIGNVYRQMSTAVASVIFGGCTFDVSTASIAECRLETAGEMEFRNCRFNSPNVTYNIRQDNGRVRVLGCEFTRAGALIFSQPAWGPTELDVFDNVWRTTPTANVLGLVKGSFAATIRGARNRFASLWSGSFTGAGTAWSGHLQFNEGRGADLTSAATITVGLTSDTYRVAAGGVATIDTIAVSGNFLLPLISGKIRLIALGAWTLSTAGNIAPRGGANKTLAAGDAVELVYDPVGSKWREV
jgi:hypothetical protein